MLEEKRVLRWGIGALVILLVMILVAPSLTQAQNWMALPPYNLLWPLWSPALSPIDAITGLATPLITGITNNTILPVQPGMAWNPAMQFPWLLYNIPPVLGGGLTFFDPYYGLNPWPPSSLLDPLLGLPSPLTLPLGFSLLAPTDLATFGPFLTQGNLSFISTYPTANFGIPLASLLTPAQIWGLPLL